MAGIITYAKEKNSGLTAARKDGFWYHPILLFDSIGKDGDFTKPLEYLIEKTSKQILFHGYTQVSHLTVDQELKKRWRRYIRRTDKGVPQIHRGADIMMCLQKYYCLHAIARTMNGKNRKLRRFIPYPQPQERVLARAIEMLRNRHDRGNPFAGDCVKLWVPTGNTYIYLFEQEMPYDGKGDAIYKLIPTRGDLRVFQDKDWV